ncbi:rap-GAP domain-containing protein DDB_G0281809-like [Drosophila innubila]|uniref:rap-GAP domain-containing protein DDB_G0281809-like n=1 Tax=Drosophila innubila TaxID=198719 RepID=UPI00148DF235|nr:rap-GAP domain-containing protein DDB_G0281809-like [Drosophila innubila]
MYKHLYKYTDIIITKLHTVVLRAITAQPGKSILFAYTRKKKEMCYPYGFLFALPLVALVCLSSAAAAATPTTPTTPTAANKHQLLMHHSHSSHHNHHHNNHEQTGKLQQQQQQQQQQQAEEEEEEVGASVSEDVVYNYLMQFDYLPKSDLETGALRTEEQLIDAIRNLQAFGNIPVTGKINQATAKLIQKPRCGVGDNKYAYNFSPDNLDHDNPHGSRVRRYVLHGGGQLEMKQ